MPRYKPRLTTGIPGAAQRLGVDVKTIRRMIADGRLKAYRLNGDGLIRINVDDLESLLVPVTS